MHPRSEVTVKIAQSLDGQIATPTGNSRWITGIESRTYAHQLRATHDAVMVGIGTVLADDPQLTVRLVEGRDPIRVVVDSGLRTPLSAALIRDAPESTLIATTSRASRARKQALESRGVRVLEVRENDRGLDLAELIEQLASQELHRILIEGGPTVITSLLHARLIDRLAFFVAPLILGQGIPSVRDLNIDSVNMGVRLEELSVRCLGTDLLVLAKPVWPAGP